MLCAQRDELNEWLTSAFPHLSTRDEDEAVVRYLVRNGEALCRKAEKRLEVMEDHVEANKELIESLRRYFGVDL